VAVSEHHACARRLEPRRRAVGGLQDGECEEEAHEPAVAVLGDDPFGIRRHAAEQFRTRGRILVTRREQREALAVARVACGEQRRGGGDVDGTERARVERGHRGAPLGARAAV